MNQQKIIRVIRYCKFKRKTIENILDAMNGKFARYELVTITKDAKNFIAVIKPEDIKYSK